MNLRTTSPLARIVFVFGFVFGQREKFPKNPGDRPNERLERFHGRIQPNTPAKAICIFALLLLSTGLKAALPILTVNAPAHVVIQDSTNLVDWQDVAETQDLTVLPTPGTGFLRGRVTQTSVTIAFDRNPAAAGTFIYLGAKSHDYFQRFDAGTNGVLPLTIILPTPDLYFTGTSYLADGTESDFAAREVHIHTPQPVLTVTVVKP
jgi:hypothetical protein